MGKKLRTSQKGNRLCIVFDLDGTLYAFKGNTFKDSPLQKKILANAKRYLATQLGVSQKEANGKLEALLSKYGEEISIGVEKEYGLNRFDYFETVWDIPARGLVTYSKGLRPLLLRLRRQYDLYLLSDAPKVWIDNVLRALNVQDVFFGRVFSGEGDERKGFGNIFSLLPKRLGCRSSNIVVVGDQVETDIIPAKQAGFKTILVNKNDIPSPADVSVRRIGDIEKALDTFT